MRLSARRELPHVCQCRRPEGNPAARAARRAGALGGAQADQAGRAGCTCSPARAKPSSCADAAFKDVAFIDDRKALVADADVVLAVQPPALDVIDAMKPGAILICFIYADERAGAGEAPAGRRRSPASPWNAFRASRGRRRWTRCRASPPWRDTTRSQLGATHLARMLPKITTAAGAIGPAKVLVMGLGVAGLEAIATAHRLGAVVEGYDVRPETQEQALSLGATFVDTGVDARGKGGYARELTRGRKGQGRRRADPAYPAGRPDHHHGRDPRQAVPEADQQGAGRRYEGRRRDRRPLRRGRRQLRGHPTRRDDRRSAR